MLKRMFAGLLAGALIACSGCSAVLSPAGSSALTVRAGGKSAGTSASGAAASSAQNGSSVPVSGGSVEYYFPRGGQPAKPALIGILKSAKTSLDMAVYSFTDTDIASAVVADKKRGVAVRVITDSQCAANRYQKTVLSELKAAGIPVKINTHDGLMHLKVSIVDRSVATTGSFNYTKGAENENDEVFVVLRSPKAATDFETQFARMWSDTGDFKNWSAS